MNNIIPKEVYEKINNIREAIRNHTKGLEFNEEEHKYTFNKKPVICVSNKIEQYIPKFNSEFHASRVAEKEGKTKKEVLHEWSENARKSCECGTMIHNFGEAIFYNKDREIIDTDFDDRVNINDVKSIRSFWNFIDNTEHTNYALIRVLAENQVYSKKYNYAGTFDLLMYLYNFDNPLKSGLIIMDYKTNSDLFNFFYNWKTRNCDSMLYPLNDMINCDAAHYTCQLNLYQIALEEALTDINVNIIGRRLIWVNNDGVKITKTLNINNINLLDKNKYKKFIFKKQHLDIQENLKQYYKFNKISYFAFINIPNKIQIIKNSLK